MSLTNLLKTESEILIEFVVFLFSLFHSLDRSVIAKVCLFAVPVSSFPRKSICFHCYGQEKINLIHYVPFVCVIKCNSLFITV